MIRYAITDRALFGANEGTRRAGVVRQMAELARAGVEFVQLREKDLCAGRLVELARGLKGELERGAARGSRRPRLLVNGRVDVAIAVGAEGVHLTSAPGELGAAEVRKAYARAGLGRPVVSVSCHSVGDVERLVARDAEGALDLMLFGPVFEKVMRVTAEPGPDWLDAVSAKVAEGSGLELLRRACAAAGETPVLALGGVTAQNVAACLAAGAAGVAAIRLFAGAAADFID